MARILTCTLYNNFKNKKMNRIKKLSLVAVAVLALSACNNKSQKKQVTEKPTTTETQKEETATNWKGVYTGTLPCADCEGIKTTLTLNNDNTFTLQSVYMGKNNQPFVENGKYIWDEANSEISINIEGEAPVKYKLENNTLTQLNADGQKNTEELASMYVLTKEN
ncbi:copper resistance protein NlpE [Ornithobacterium rhinotracheale]|nr:copper resistance protein NlpE [Ornithobacterium rhinotracheale]AIQ00062.1 hypothetical protein Q785_10900 [Ornithobacterium rhinotracheale ORT-UMN 88]KGB66401.1 hypothetical protein Q787_10495 [Ornithobacterium rhinotracheale H06-030791]MCK0193366.1 copper resistance protein NlpE N-terminal domain-containing protein [Ornithobacterium rhinotracheale]MCK0201219.1 copper resistance protein NlpE N-terminal domain-containing protein [Ornithobacterium rhinotracheale]MCK0201663.1 copper resistanc